MSSRNGCGKPDVMSQISNRIGADCLDATESPWEIAAREPKNKGGVTDSSKPWPQQNTALRAWLPPGTGTNEIQQHVNPHPVEDDDLNNDSDTVDSDSDELLSDDFDSDASDHSFESRKKNKWLKAFFSMLDTLTVEEINEPARQWHCPACQSGPGAINWFRGLQPLMIHAKTKGSIRVMLHREFSELLDEELRRRGISAIPTGEALGKWKEKRCKTAMSSSNDSGNPDVMSQISNGIGVISLDSTESSWEIAVREPKDKGSVPNSSKPWPQQNTAPRAWVPPGTIHLHVNPHPEEDDDFDNADDSDSDSVDSDDDDELLSDDLDSDASDQSFGSRKKNKWLKAFFTMLDTLTVEEINEPVRQWHCPACQGGPGAINWFRGLQALMIHAKTKGSIRVMLHREFAELLDEELRRRGTSVIPAGEAFGKWKGLKENGKDREIVWPPMVVVMIAKLEQGENDKWIGMGNQELLDYFHQYAATKACHSYDPQGHQGMSMLIFESSAIGYLEAELLHEHFKEEGTDREAWDRRRVSFYPGGERLLYGYMAEKQDLDYFNQHSQGESRLKYEMRSYHKMVVSQLRQMSEANQQLVLFKDKVAKLKKHSKALEESYDLVSEKLRRTLEENRTARQTSEVHHEQNKKEMDSQEDFFNSQLKNIHDARDAKEDSYERLQQEVRQKMKQSMERREDGIENFKKSQIKEIEAFVGERDKLMKIFGEEIAEIKHRYHEEVVELEKKIDAQLNELMAKYTLQQSQ